MAGEVAGLTVSISFVSLFLARFPWALFFFFFYFFRSVMVIKSSHQFTFLEFTCPLPPECKGNKREEMSKGVGPWFCLFDLFFAFIFL